MYKQSVSQLLNECMCVRASSVLYLCQSNALQVGLLPHSFTVHSSVNIAAADDKTVVAGFRPNIARE